MPTTIKAVVRASEQRRDGTYNVKIQVTHRRRSVRVSTNFYVDTKQLGRNLEIKDASVLDVVDPMLRRWRVAIGQLESVADDMTVEEIVAYLKTTEDRKDGFHLDFIDYMRRVGEALTPGTGKNYRTTANALARFTGGQPLDISTITVRMLRSFEQFLRNEASKRGSNRKEAGAESTKGGRAVSLYLGIVRAVHNRARAEFNDEDTGEINIPYTPFAHYKIPKEMPAKKRALKPETIQRIINLPDEIPEEYAQLAPGRRDQARDCFLLSFGLAGMNAVDLYLCPASALKGDIITYNRQKTASRRVDRAEMQIRVEPQFKAIVERLRDPAGQRLFCFYRQYATADNFTRALNEGLKRIEKELGGVADEKHITFYSARHTWATLARSSALNIDKYTVHEALNHVDPDLRITDRYVERDWSVIWRANAAVLGLFDWAGLEIREMLR